MISVIVPNANEKRIQEVIHEIEDLLQEGEVIVSVDRDRKGKGWAIREALQEAKGDIIIFLDGDMDIHPKMIRRLVYHLDEFDIVVGKKDTRNRLDRYILTLLSRLLIFILFRINVDTQTGIKVFKRHALPNWKCNDWAFDIEILAKAKQKGFSMFEVTIDASITKGMKLKSILKTLVSTLKIWGEVKRNGV